MKKNESKKKMLKTKKKPFIDMNSLDKRSICLDQLSIGWNVVIMC